MKSTVFPKRLGSPPLVEYIGNETSTVSAPNRPTVAEELTQMVDYMLQFDVNSRLCLGHLDLQSWAFLISLFLDPQRWGNHRIWEALAPPKFRHRIQPGFSQVKLALGRPRRVEASGISHGSNPSGPARKGAEGVLCALGIFRPQVGKPQ